jgi:hypothetical protein
MKSDRHPLPSPTLSAMRNLRASGEKSFEALVARLLARLSGRAVRLCQAGTQDGADAIADIPFAVEAKRHKSKVSTRELLGGLASAALKYRDLELWVVAATCAVGAQAANDLRRSGEERGIGTLIFDTSPSAQLPAASGIIALAASDVEITTEVLGDSSWRIGGRSPQIDAIRAELTAVREQHSFNGWAAHIETVLRDLPTWRRFVRNHNAILREQISRYAGVTFGTPFEATEAISRDAEVELSRWFDECVTTDKCPIAVIVGDRYDGKTWLVYRWLSEELSSLRLPAFFFSSDQVKAENGHIDAMVEAQVRRAMGQFSPHAAAMLERQKHAAKDSSSPWCVIVLDGANEYATDPTPFRTAMTTALPVGADEADAALIVTCRSQDFKDGSWWLENRSYRCVQVGPFNDREFEVALTRHSLSTKDVDQWAESARNLMRHPRYLRLAIAFWMQLPLFRVVTADVLRFLDTTEKVIPRSPGVQLDPEALQTLLANLAEEWLKERKLDLKTVRSRVAELTDDVDASAHSITSRGILARQDGQFILNERQFEFGMGLLIRKTLMAVEAANFPAKLEELLQPHRSDDEKVRWLRAAVATSAAAREGTPSDVLDFLIAEWLSARNFSKGDLDDLRNLVPLVVEPVLRLLSSGKLVHKNVVTVAEPIIRAAFDRNETAVARAVRTWFRIVPAGAHWFIGDEGATPEDVGRAPAEPSFTDLKLSVAERNAGQSVRERQRLGLSLACECAGLVGLLDILALFASRRAAGGYLDEGERLAVRRILATEDTSWFEAEVRTWSKHPDSGRTAALRDLIAITDRNELLPLLSKLPKLDTPQFHRQFTRVDLSELRGNDEAAAVLRNAEQLAHLALDPDCPSPSRSWRTAFERIEIERFVGSPELHSGRSPSRDDLDLDDIEPALAAWAPKAGVRIWRAFFDDIPRRIGEDDPAWSWVLGGHLTLLTGSQRRRLLAAILQAIPKVEKMNHALERGYGCIVAQSSASKRLKLLLGHPFDVEWHSLYEALALGRDVALRNLAIAAVRREGNPVRRKRSRCLLIWIGGMALTVADIESLLDDNACEPAIAPEFLGNSRLARRTPPNALAPLMEVVREPSEVAKQYDAFLVGRELGLRKLNAAGVARALSAPETARVNGASVELPDEAAVKQGLQRLAERITVEISDPKSFLGRSEQFPINFAAQVPEPEFEKWVQLLLASPRYAHLRRSGLLLPIVHHALKTAHPAAYQLWELVYPFNRGNPMGTRFVDHGLDSRLCDLHDPAIDDSTARSILRALVRDTRSNSELIQVALSGRLESAIRLTCVINELLVSADELDRARARYLAGWMADNAILRARLASNDPSLWVKSIGDAAIRRLDRERWAHHWLTRFLIERSAERRWAAGRLFVACSDVATPFWASGAIWKASRSPAIRRAEASLLVDSVRKKPDDSEFRDSFLGYRVSDLERVIPPWRRAIRWDDIVVKNPEETK